MKLTLTTLTSALLLSAASTAFAASTLQNTSIQLGPRPFYLIDKMDDGDLKINWRPAPPTHLQSPIGQLVTARAAAVS
ncbi:MAG: hypothetical protein U5K75_04220 [Ahrensia sp.]|nr:hypothetical protein [Ahrensia sp.]